jgi:hypothetical protein
MVFVLVYVDGIIVAGSSKEAISTLIKDINTNFAIKDLGELHYFLGTKVKKSSEWYSSYSRKICFGASRKSWYDCM